MEEQPLNPEEEPQEVAPEVEAAPEVQEEVLPEPQVEGEAQA